MLPTPVPHHLSGVPLEERSKTTSNPAPAVTARPAQGFRPGLHRLSAAWHVYKGSVKYRSTDYRRAGERLGADPGGRARLRFSQRGCQVSSLEAGRSSPSVPSFLVRALEMWTKRPLQTLQASLCLSAAHRSLGKPRPAGGGCPEHCPWPRVLPTEGSRLCPPRSPGGSPAP